MTHFNPYELIRICCFLLVFHFAFNGQNEGKDKSEEPERPGAIISNHVSYIDILYHMSSFFPSFVAKVCSFDMLHKKRITYALLLFHWMHVFITVLVFSLTYFCSKSVNCIWVSLLKRSVAKLPLVGLIRLVHFVSFFKSSAFLL